MSKQKRIVTISKDAPRDCRRRIKKTLQNNPNAHDYWRRGLIHKAASILADDYLSTAHLIVRYSQVRL